MWRYLSRSISQVRGALPLTWMEERCTGLTVERGKFNARTSMEQTSRISSRWVLIFHTICGAVDNASVSLRFRIMTGVKAGANILNANQYPQIGDNTLNFAVPCPDSAEQNLHTDRMKTAFEQMKCSALFSHLEPLPIKHHFNGNFLVFQIDLSA